MADLVLDLSNNNPKPNFYKLSKNGVKGIMFKVSEGATFTDGVFKDWSWRARRNGIRVGGYHFAQPNGGDPIAEARHFADKLGEIKLNDFRPALDLESNPGSLSWSQLVAWSRAFNQEFFKITKTLPMFYASKGWIQSMNADVPIGAALWLAHWSNNGQPFTPSAPFPWKNVHLHQYTSNGTVPGAVGRVDKNQILRLRPLLAHPDILDI